MGNLLRSYMSPGHIIVCSIFFAILTGTFLLSLPQATIKTIPLIDLFFTATSATCVTGLFTISLEQFTPFGQSVLLGLIQIGGIGLITTTLFFIYIFLNVGLAANVMASKLLEIGSWKDLRRILVLIIFITVITELIGGALIYTIIKTDLPSTRTLFFAMFHAISSFCNAGIVLTGGLFKNYGDNPYLMSITTALMFFGGLGFITWYELIGFCGAYIRRKRFRFSLQSSIVLRMSFFLVAITTLLYLALEHSHSLTGLSLPFASLIALFHAVSFKSTGFLMTSITALHPATLFMLMIIAFIGSSPASTGSGIKITTLAVFIATIKSTFSGRMSVEINGRRIPNDQVYRAIAIIAVSIGWIFFSTFLLLITETNWQFTDIIFESLSAFTTLGITTGATASLSTMGKIIIIASMIIGRIGSLTLLLSLKLKKDEDTIGISYPEERVMLG